MLDLWSWKWKNGQGISLEKVFNALAYILGNLLLICRQLWNLSPTVNLLLAFFGVLINNVKINLVLLASIPGSIYIALKNIAGRVFLTSHALPTPFFKYWPTPASLFLLPCFFDWMGWSHKDTVHTNVNSMKYHNKYILTLSAMCSQHLCYTE